MSARMIYKTWKHSPTIVRLGIVGVGAFMLQRRMRRRLEKLF